jgi:hypothetical protein
MQVFVPVEDASLDREAGPLVPYRCGLACAHELRGGLVLRDGVWLDPVLLSDGSASRRPAPGPACAPAPH